MLMLLLTIWLVTETTCSLPTVQAMSFGEIKTQVEAVLSGPKDLPTKTGESLATDPECRHQQFPMVLMISTAPDLSTPGLMVSF